MKVGISLIGWTVVDLNGKLSIVPFVAVFCCSIKVAEAEAACEKRDYGSTCALFSAIANRSGLFSQDSPTS